MSNYKGQIKDFPREIVEKMLEHQVAQGNAKDVTIFETNVQVNIGQGGFSWGKAPEGFGFWIDVIYAKNFDLFFEKYPREIIMEEKGKDNLIPFTKEAWKTGRYKAMYPNAQGDYTSFIQIFEVGEYVMYYRYFDGIEWHPAKASVNDTLIMLEKNPVMKFTPVFKDRLYDTEEACKKDWSFDSRFVKCIEIEVEEE